VNRLGTRLGGYLLVGSLVAVVRVLAWKYLG